jgi:hypothetical protein
MGDQSRKFTPRQRNRRPLGLQASKDKAPAIPLSAPIKRGDYWFVSAPLASRLHQKSGLGQTTSDGGILLLSEEVLFCHWYRHMPLPKETWFSEQLKADSQHIARAVVFDVARSGGELVIPINHLKDELIAKIHPNTWAVRWRRDQSFSKEQPEAQTRWACTNDSVDILELLDWARDVKSEGYIPELYIVDEEMDVTMYRLDIIDMKGNQKTWVNFSAKQQDSVRQLWSQRLAWGDGWYIPHQQQWTWPTVGIEHMSGRLLRKEEGEWLTNIISNDDESTSVNSLFAHLMSKGLIIRPGFKFGCRWRVYDDAVEQSHAPWLVQTESDAPSTWEGICLSVRLAEGVHKSWVCILRQQEDWNCLQIKRWLPGRT